MMSFFYTFILPAIISLVIKLNLSALIFSGKYSRIPFIPNEDETSVEYM